MRYGICVAALLLAPVAGVAQPAAGAREAFLKICGGCHPVDTVTSQRRSRAQWQESINSMVTRGAKGTSDELAAILRREIEAALGGAGKDRWLTILFTGDADR